MVRERRRAERLGFREGNGSVKRPKMAYSWFKTSLTSRRAGSRRDVKSHVATWQRELPNDVAT